METQAPRKKKQWRYRTPEAKDKMALLNLHFIGNQSKCKWMGLTNEKDYC